MVATAAPPHLLRQWREAFTPSSSGPLPAPVGADSRCRSGPLTDPERHPIPTRRQETGMRRSSRRSSALRGRPVFTRSPTPHSATRTGRRWHPGAGPVPIDRSGPRGRIITSAVTVKVAKRSASGPDTAGASGPGLAPPPGAARSLLQRPGGLPAEDGHPCGCCGLPSLVERSRQGG